MVKDHVNDKGLFQCFRKEMRQKASIFNLPLKPKHKKNHIHRICLLAFLFLSVDFFIKFESRSGPTFVGLICV